MVDGCTISRRAVWQSRELPRPVGLDDAARAGGCRLRVVTTQGKDAHGSRRPQIVLKIVSMVADEPTLGLYSKRKRFLEICMRPDHTAANLSVDAELLEQARRLDIDVQRVAERALFLQIRERRSKVEHESLARKWKEENSDAFAYSNEYVERNGLPLARYRQF
jgi:antitoxin CcdA